MYDNIYSSDAEIKAFETSIWKKADDGNYDPAEDDERREVAKETSEHISGKLHFDGSTNPTEKTNVTAFLNKKDGEAKAYLETLRQGFTVANYLKDRLVRPVVNVTGIVPDTINDNVDWDPNTRASLGTYTDFAQKSFA